MTDDQWICETCGNDVTEMGCGFIFRMGKVRECEYCQVKKNFPDTHAPLLLSSEEEKLEP